MLYEFSLRARVIRSLDEKIINSKDATVIKTTRGRPWSIGAPNTWSNLVKLIPNIDMFFPKM
jgi:protein associated with RNAse G/E